MVSSMQIWTLFSYKPTSLIEMLSHPSVKCSVLNFSTILEVSFVKSYQIDMHHFYARAFVLTKVPKPKSRFSFIQTVPKTFTHLKSK